MLRPFRERVRILSAVVAAGFLALWLGTFASACMAATGSACGTPGGDCVKADVSIVTVPCQQAMAPCKLPPLDTPVCGTFDFSFTPVVTGIESFRFVVPPKLGVPPQDWQARRAPRTPLYLTYLSLLN